MKKFGLSQFGLFCASAAVLVGSEAVWAGDKDTASAPVYQSTTTMAPDATAGPSYSYPTNPAQAAPGQQPACMDPGKAQKQAKIELPATAWSFLMRPAAGMANATSPSLSEKLLKFACDAAVESVMDSKPKVLAENVAKFLSDNRAHFLSGNSPNLLSGNSPNLLSGNAPELLSDNETELFSENEMPIFSANEGPVLSGNKLQMLSGNKLVIQIENREREGASKRAKKAKRVADDEEEEVEDEMSEEEVEEASDADRDADEAELELRVERRTKRLFRQLDLNRDGTLSPEEFTGEAVGAGL